MELNILENSKNKMKIEVKGEDHTFCNAVKEELWNDKSIKASGYFLENPMMTQPILIVHGEGDVKKAIFSAVERLKKQNKELKTLFTKLK